ncbi:MAG: imidazole glycerol phosphate synthase subunit HisH [Bacteroidales bacterium]|jgi:glutamine amidotransferase|nr:imidazole glycerol phosphate synthase subunit HisH [Bacteroidales bacterium]
MIAIIDYDAGNIRSVGNALQRLGAEYELTADPARILAADKVILPGVGNAARAMENLRERGLCELITGLRRPVLGICVGMQLMCRDSEEGPTQGLGLFDARVRRFIDTPGAKVPHMGWNAIGNLDSKLFKDLPGGSFVYFVHSYYPTLCPDTIATCRHGGQTFSAALKYENFYGTQFHPEKSGSAGAAILRNFLAL